jgi:hypothetical protein
VRALAQRTNLNILLSGRLADDVITNALNGSFTPADALGQLVAGTPLAYAMADEHTFPIWNCAEFRCAAIDSVDSDAQDKGDREAGQVNYPDLQVCAPYRNRSGSQRVLRIWRADDSNSGP